MVTAPFTVYTAPGKIPYHYQYIHCLHSSHRLWAPVVAIFNQYLTICANYCSIESSTNPYNHSPAFIAMPDNTPPSFSSIMRRPN